jgi:site-specific DNA-methyltransferase (adenine-specific)/modification methylase
MTSWREEVFGDNGEVRLIQADCRDVLPTLGKVDAVVTDPPYGLGNLWGVGGCGAWPLRDRDMQSGAWDKTTCEEAVTTARKISENSVIWGGNYYELPPARGWLIWDKMQEHSTAHAEMAWTNLNIPVRTFRYARAQLASEGKQHPTQKPLPLMVWCLGFLPVARTILDPFAGSGTTGVACVQLGRRFIGIELEPRYFDIACRRISDELKRPRLPLDEPRPMPTQEALL